jgi:hypothetical protein
MPTTHRTTPVRDAALASLIDCRADAADDQ